jgi:integrase
MRGDRKMETVEPIRSREKILQIKVKLKGEESPRNYLLFTLGLNLGARISDILNLRVKDVTKSNSYIWVREGKTNKEKKFTINKASREALDYSILSNGYLLQSLARG